MMTTMMMMTMMMMMMTMMREMREERSRLELGMAFSLTQHNFYDEKKM